MTNDQRQVITQAQRAYMDQNWDDYDALVQEVAWKHEISVDEAYQVVENGPFVY